MTRTLFELMTLTILLCALDDNSSTLHYSEVSVRVTSLKRKELFLSSSGSVSQALTQAHSGSYSVTVTQSLG